MIRQQPPLRRTVFSEATTILIGIHATHAVRGFVVPTAYLFAA